MLDRLTALFDKKNPRSIENHDIHTPDEFHLAAAVLLVYAATSDADFNTSEKSQIERLCETKFELTPEEAHALMEAAGHEVDESVQLLKFTRTIKDGFSYDERINLIEMLWEVVYADQFVHANEAQLMRRISGLIYVDDRDSGMARARVKTRFNL